MQVTKINNTISVQLKNSNDQPNIIQTIRFFDRFNVDLYNKIKKLRNEFTPLSNRIEK